MKRNTNTRFTLIFMMLVILSLVISACATPATPAPVPTQDVGGIQTQSAQTVVADLTSKAPPPATATTAPSGPTPNPSIPVAVVPTADPSGPSAVANFNTVIYSGPGTNYVVYGAFLGSQTAVVVGKSDPSGWWAISVPVAPNGNGWVAANAVTVRNTDNVPTLPTPPVPASTAMVPPGPSDPQATAIANTYIRSGPATNYPAYGIAQAGSSGLVIGKSEDGQWWAVRLNPQNVGAGYGWVSAQFVTTANTTNVQTIQNPETFTVATPPPPAAGAATGTSTEYLNVRSGPGTNYPVLVAAPPNTTGEITGKSSDGQWWQVKVSTQYSSTGFGWVSAQFVIAQNTGNVPVVQAPPPPPTVAAVPPTSITTGCALVSQSPADGTQINVGQPFNTTWVLKNTSSNAWDQNSVDIVYAGAYNNVQMHTGSDLFDLSANVNAGATYNFTVSMIAPFNAGTYGEGWQVQQGNTVLCQFYVYITVP